MAVRNTLAEIKHNIETYVGEKVRVKANRGRRKTMIKEGVLEKTYPSIFVVRLNEENGSARRISFSYADVLTSTVELTICRKDGYERVDFAG